MKKWIKVKYLINFLKLKGVNKTTVVPKLNNWVPCNLHFIHNSIELNSTDYVFLLKLSLLLCLLVYFEPLLVISAYTYGSTGFTSSHKLSISAGYDSTKLFDSSIGNRSIFIFSSLTISDMIEMSTPNWRGIWWLFSIPT